MTRFEKMTVALSIFRSLFRWRQLPLLRTQPISGLIQLRRRLERRRNAESFSLSVRTHYSGTIHTMKSGELHRRFMGVTLTLVNIGKRPMKDVIVSVAHQPRRSDGLEVGITGFGLVRQKGSEKTILFLISPAIPPGATIDPRKRLVHNYYHQSKSGPDLLLTCLIDATSSFATMTLRKEGTRNELEVWDVTAKITLDRQLLAKLTSLHFLESSPQRAALRRASPTSPPCFERHSLQC